MFTTKKDVDQHVRSALVKLKSENEKKLRGFTIAKLYYKINEFEIARHYISNYLSIKDDCAPAHKLLGQCYQQLKKPQKALESFQRSLQLDPKQSDLLIEVCKLLLSDNNLNINKAKYWCELAESEKVQHDAVFSLRLKLLNENNMENTKIEELILKEINTRPNDPNLKVRLIKHYIEENKILDAFKYAYEQEIKSYDLFLNCSEWYNIVWLALNKYKNQTNTNKNWEFWLLLIICLERQIEMSFTIMNGGSITEIKNLLFNFDQYLYEASKIIDNIFPEKEFAKKFLNHFKGQLCLYAASLIFKREQIQNKNQWKDNTKITLPLLLFAFQCGTTDIQESWLKHCNDKIKQIIQLWNREGAFRCSQAGRTLLSCIQNNDLKENSITSVSSQVHQIITDKNFWTSSDELLSQVRKFCSDNNWRNKIYRILFADSDQIRKMSTSFLINSNDLIEPLYELPSYADIESYEEIAQYLKPQSLQHMVYLCLGLENLNDVRCKYFNGLNFSTQNLNFCGSESLNQLDIETFLYATVIQAKRLLEIERIHNENYNSIKIGKPLILPYVNMQENLCTEEQNNWWQYAYQVYRNLINGENLSEIRTTLQYGIEAVRGINGPKMDLIIVLKLGKIFNGRSQDVTKQIEKNYLEQRTEILYKHALNIYKLHNKGILEPFRKLFKYSNSNSSSVEKEINELAEDAIIYLAGRYFKNCEFEECIEEFSGIQLPFATYFQAEAYKKLDESNKTPKKTKKLFLDKARDCLNQTVNLLNYPNMNTSHPLNSIVHSEIKRLQFIREIANENLNNGHYSTINIDNPSTTTTMIREYDHENSIYYGRTGGILDGSIVRRESFSSIGGSKLTELENLVKQIATTLTFVKEELVDMIKPELKDTRKELTEFKSGMKTDLNEFKSGLKNELNEFKSGIKTELNELREKLLLIDENMKKKSQTPSRDDASNVLDDLYLIGDDLQNQVYSNQNNLYSGYIQTPVSQQLQTTQRFHTPNVLSGSTHHTSVVPPPSHAQSTAASPWFSPDYFTAQQFLPFPPAAAASDRQHPNFTQRFSFSDATNTPINFNMQLPPPQTVQPPPVASIPPHQQTVVIPPQQLDNRTNLFGLITNQQQQPTSIQSSKTPTQPTNVLTMKNTSPALWNRVSNNAPVEKGPPVNVVITSSDPLPTTNTSIFPQPTLSVTIPPQHIKSNFMTNDTTFSAGSSINNQQSNTNFPISTQSFATIPHTKSITTTSNETLSLSSLITGTTSSVVNEISTKQPIQTTALNLNKSTENHDEDDDENRSIEKNVEYDPRPDFKPIIPLPDEIEVKTGEEDENVLFCARAKLFRHVNKEWKERGIGNIKILKNKNDGRIRILMRRDQTHKICANHYITTEMNLISSKNDEKSYIWAAKDYADEEEKSETLCVRFKQPEIAKEFYNVFNKVKNEIENSTNLNKTDEIKSAVTTTTTAASAENPLSKSTTIFNFNTQQKTNEKTQVSTTTTTTTTTTKSIFSITNTIGTNQQPQQKSEEKGKSDDANKNKSPFAGFTFDTKTISNTATDTSSTPFANLFANIGGQTSTSFPSITSKPSASVSVTTNSNNNPTENALNKSTLNDEGDNGGGDDDFVPTAEFKPIIPLPDLVEVQTGEENETILFEHRAKLLRYDKTCNQWKERGIGNIKLLVEKQNSNCVRLLMRREHVLKVCINLRITKSMIFKLTPNRLTSLQFGGKDYSDEIDGKTELFTIRFKTEEICKNFHDAILKAQSNMTNDGENNLSITKNQKKETNTKENNQQQQQQEKQQQQQKGFGDQFKPKIGSWNCNTCYISNTGDNLYCVACDSPKDDTIPKKSTKDLLSSDNKSQTNTTTPKFTFGFGTNSEATSTIAKPTAPAVSGFGDQFKPKVGSWNCNTCYISNTGDNLYCVACDSPKDDTVPKKDNNTKNSMQMKNIFGISTTPSSSFTFGFQNTGSKPFESKAVDLTQQQQSQQQQQQQQPFKFGFSSDNSSTKIDDKSKSNIFTFDPKNIPTTGNNPISGGFSFSTTSSSSTFPTFDNKTTSISVTSSSTSSLSKPAFSFTMPKNTTTISTTVTTTTTIVDNSTSSSSNDEFKLEKKEFNFVLKPKSPGKAKSPLKNNTSGYEEESDNENVEEENSAYFTPVIPLPDKIEVKTGEENEMVLYCHRAKLFRFANSEWKERGLGDIKILRHQETKKLRVVMRREQILKICLNHVLTDDIEYMRKDDKSWHFVVKDFSEGELELTQFCIRFKTKEIAEEFMNAIKNALMGNDDKIQTNEAAITSTLTSSIQEVSNDENNKKEKIKTDEKDKNTKDSKDNDNDKMKNDQKLAEKLKLPLNFFEITNNHENCMGCRGCDPEKFVFPEYKDENQIEEEKPLPLEMSGIDFSKKLNISSGINGSGANSSILKQSSFSFGQKQQEKEEKQKEKVEEKQEKPTESTEKKSLFDGSGFNFGSKSTNIFSLGDNINFGSTGSFNFNPTGQKSIFGGHAFSSNTTTPVFGISNVTTTSGSLFGSASIFSKPSNDVTNTTSDNSTQQQQQQQKSVFGGISFAKPLNTDNSTPQFTFGNKAFETGSIFGGKSTNSNVVVSSSELPATTVTPATTTSSLTINKTEIITPTTNIFKDPGISFSDLASKSAEFKANDKPQTTTLTGGSGSGGFIGLTQNDAFRNFSNPQFQKTANDKSLNTSDTKTGIESTGNDNGVNDTTKDDDSNYDPHYDPIIELPDKIEVKTGEENEEKLFGERATLFRYDADTKQWKERGVGELKILHHPINGTYRLLLRREQIHKLVLNHIISDDFSMKPMNNSGKAFCWAAQNYAEEPTWEKLACRFKHVEIGQKFENEINKCIKQLKKRSNIEPEED